MNAMNQPTSPPSVDTRPRKPRIALMGEFSAGKSTLMNLLLGFDPLPVQITATRVPPVWVSRGQQSVTRIRTDGEEDLLTLEDLADTPLEGTQVIRVSLESEILELCDLMDIPGISDPNISHEDWSALVDEVDSVIWCTHATQAWRQSEAAIWEEISARTNGNNILLVTQFDKLQSDRDRSRVLARLRKEAGHLFQAIYPLATLEALEAGEDEEIWKKSGGAAFVEHLVGMLVQPGVAHLSVAENADRVVEPNIFREEPFDRLDRDVSGELASGGETPDAVEDDEDRIVPRRIRPKLDKVSRPSPEEVQRLDADPGDVSLDNLSESA